MDKIYVIYKNNQKMDYPANGYTTKKGAKAALTYKKNHSDEIGNIYEIKAFVPIEEISIFELIKNKLKG